MSPSTVLNQCATPGGDAHVSGADVTALPTLDRRAGRARADEDRVNHVVGRHRSLVGDRPAGDERP